MSSNPFQDMKSTRVVVCPILLPGQNHFCPGQNRNCPGQNNGALEVIILLRQEIFDKLHTSTLQNWLKTYSH